MFKISLSKEADKAYSRFPHPDKKKIDKVIERMSADPFVGSKRLQGEFTGLYAVRAWPYRVTYTVDIAIKKISIVAIAHRQSVYK